MAEFDRGALHIVSTKLRNLHKQVQAALSDDLSNEDVRAALNLMKDNLGELISEVADAQDYSESLREGIILEATEHISLYSDVLGTVIRSSVTRNPFELYHPFKNIVKRFFPNESVYLILSSEWQYVPFTYPFTLDGLPDFVLIGMPAAEADNVLAFPLAGHELGHSIWKRKGLVGHFSAKAFEITRRRFEESPELLSALYPTVTVEQFESDLFSSRLKDTAISQIIELSQRQTEELFCDLVGIELFGDAYLHAFRYLLAPTERGERSPVYPELLERASILDEYQASRGLGSARIARWFNKEDEIGHPFYSQLVRLADGVRKEMWPTLMEIVEGVLKDAALLPINYHAVDRAANRFKAKLPVEANTSLGELICAAWNCYSDSFSSDLSSSRNTEVAVSNLVLKSAEAMEFKVRMSIASH